MEEIWLLSSQYESDGDPGAIGYDAGGGWSFGLSQISTATGAFGMFLEYVKANYTAIYNVLIAAGGFSGASAGTPLFQQAWKQCVTEFGDTFAICQHEFIVDSYYNVTIHRLNGVNIDLISPPRTVTLANVIYSMAVMAGPGAAKANGSGCCGLVFDAVGIVAVNTLDDAPLINSIYSHKLERIDSGREYAQQTPQIRASVRNRIVNEHLSAVTMLAQERSL